MSGVQNTNPLNGALPLPRPQAATPTPPQANPGLAGDQLRLTATAQPAPQAAPQPQAPAAPAPAAEAQLRQLRVAIMAGSPVESAGAISQLAHLPPAQAMPVLLDQLRPGSVATNMLAAIQVLDRMPNLPPEALARLRELKSSAGDPSVQAAARATHDRLVPPPTAPAGQPGGPVSPNRPLTGPSAQAAPPSRTDLNGLIARLADPKQAPAAAVELSRLPTDQVLYVASRMIDYIEPSPEAMELLVTVLGKRHREPGVAELLQKVTRKDPATHFKAIGKAALILTANGNPAYTTDIFRFMLHRNSQLAPIKRAIIDTLARNPARLSHPAAGTTLAAVLHEQESPDLAASASHALGKIRTPQARDALAASPLFSAADAKLRMRALWDLGNHPAPYPPKAVEALRRLAEDLDPQVKAKARELLSRKPG